MEKPTPTQYDALIAALIEASPALADKEGKIIASCGISVDTPVVRETGAELTQAKLDKASMALRGIMVHARAWNWGKVEGKLDRAYRALGGSNPATGYAFHRGAHPVQSHLS